MGIRETLCSALEKSGAMCDDCLAAFTAIKPRQTVNARCRDLERAGHLSRLSGQCPRCNVTKIVNRQNEHGKPPVGLSPLVASAPAKLEASAVRPWYWEGNVQRRIVEFLASGGWEIISNANTAIREAGKDIVAMKGAEELWVSVKGWPEKSVNTQARHWFAGAIFDLILYRELDPHVNLGIGIPAGYSTYANLIPRVRWLRANLPFTIFGVSEAGDIEVLEP